MNTTIIKGTIKTGAGKAIKRWAKLTGNRKLYFEGLAEELIGKTQRSYGRLKDKSAAIQRRIMKQDATKAMMKQAKKMHLSFATVTSLALVLVPLLF